MGLNAEQIQAVTHFTGPCLVKATPGSGKTSVLTERIGRLISKGISPSNIMCLTFTNKAATEMKSRAYKKIGDKASEVWISTFHSMCVKFLRKLGPKIGIEPNFTIYDDKDQSDLILQIARKMEMDAFGTLDVYRVQYAINTSRENLENVTDYEEELSAQQFSVAVKYLSLVDEMGVLDFSGLLHKTWSLFDQFPQIKEKVSSHFKFIMVDESQDTNFIQYQIIRQIGQHGNIFIVGDLDQSIYSWRSARPENLNDFINDFDSVVTIPLPRNYRSTEKILKACQTLINHNANAKETVLIADSKEHALPVFIQPCSDGIAEARYVASEISRLHSQGIAYDEMAILYRLNSLSREHEMQLRNNNIPYKVMGGFSFFDRKEIINALAYLRLYSNLFDTIAFARAIQYPSRQIGPAKIGIIENIVHDDKVDVSKAIEKAMLQDKGLTITAKDHLRRFIATYNKCFEMKASKSPVLDIITVLFKETGFWAQVQKDSETDDASVNRLDNLKEFIVGIDQYFKDNPKNDMSDYLQTIQIMTKDKSDTDTPGVSMMTIHAAKGLEFPIVFVVGAEEGVIPHRRALADNEDDDSEERRLMYVACSRAKSRLTISHSHQRNNQRKQLEPSRFIIEIGKATDAVKTNSLFYGR